MMTMQPDSLQNILQESTVRLEHAASTVANAHGIATRGAAAASLAQESMFAEAMLAAVHARIAENKEVTH